MNIYTEERSYWMGSDVAKYRRKRAVKLDWAVGPRGICHPALCFGDYEPEHLVIDAMFLPEITIPQTALIKGDRRSLSIAAASILAKTARDRWMESLATTDARYAFDRNKGYGTRAHQSALQEHGPCPEHRFSYSPVRTSKK